MIEEKFGGDPLLKSIAVYCSILYCYKRPDKILERFLDKGHDLVSLVAGDALIKAGDTGGKVVRLF